MGLCVVVKGSAGESTLAVRTLILDMRGVIYRDRDFTVQLPWERVYGVGTVPRLRDQRVDVASGGSSGLVGGGTLTATDRASEASRRQLEKNLQAAPRDPQTGEPAFGVPLALFDRAWRAGRIGQWVEHYRPGLPVTAEVIDDR